MSGYYGATVTEQADAVLYTATYVEGSGWTLYNGSTYISVSVSGTYYNVAYSSDPYYFDYDEANHAFTSTIDDVTVAYGGRSTYTTSGFYNVASYGSSMYYAHCYEVISYPSIKGLTLSASAESVYVGETVSVSASYYPTCIESADLTWASDNTEVATVADGVVTGVAEGSVTITATTSNGVSGSITLTVEAAPTGYGTETVVASELGYEGGTAVSEISGTSYTLALNKGTHSSNSPTYYAATSSEPASIRCYGTSSGSNNLVFTPTEGYTLVSIEITCVSSSRVGGECTYDNATAVVNDAVITITPTDGTAAVTITVGSSQLRIVSYTVTYMAA